jgi:iron complex transport system ATP-binding protein
MDSMIPKSVIETKGLTIGYAKRNTVKSLCAEINVEAKQGELIALIGSNGIGKSTLIKTLCLIHPALGGQIRIDSKPASTFTRNDAAKSISLVSTELFRSNNLKVGDLVGLGRYPHGNWFAPLNGQDQVIIQTALSDVGMAEFAHRPINELSDGEYQRVMIARAMAQDTPIVFLDEPTAFLDLSNKFIIFALLWRLTREQSKTVIFSTHDINIAMQFADVFWVMTQKGLQVGAPEDLLMDGTIEKLFAGSDVYFDAKSNQFRNCKSLNQSICLQGDGLEFQLTKLALERLGFFMDCNKPTNVSVKITKTVQKTCWELTKNGITYKCNSISELQQALR